MPHEASFVTDSGKEFIITNGIFSNFGTVRITLSADEIENLSDEEIIYALREFAKHKETFEALSRAYEYEWNAKSLSPYHLSVIANSEIVSEKHKQKALYLLKNPETSLEPKENEKTRKSKFTKDGYIYLIKSDTGHYKIGRSKDVFDRIKTFSIKLPFEIELIHQFPADDTLVAEAQLHKNFAQQRVNGEWFDLTPQMVDNIKNLTSYENSVFRGVV
jgi:hypothetical protein